MKIAAGTGIGVSGTCTITRSGICTVAIADPNLFGAIQMARNGSFAVAPRTMPTSDNSYSLDGWRLLLENANGATITQDPADVQTGAGYAAKLVVGSGNNGKFGLFSILENKDILKVKARSSYYERGANTRRRLTKQNGAGFWTTIPSTVEKFKTQPWATQTPPRATSQPWPFRH